MAAAGDMKSPAGPRKVVSKSSLLLTLITDIHGIAFYFYKF